MDNNNKLKVLLLATIVMVYSNAQAQETWTLDKCIERGLEKNLDIQRSDLLRSVSEANLKQSRYSRLPSLNGGVTHGYNWGQTIDPFTNQFATDRVRNNNVFLNSDVVLFNGFQVNNRIKQGELDLKASEEDLQRMRNDIGLLIAQSFLNVLFNTEQLKAAESQYQISERQVQRMERLVEAGQEAEVSLFDVQSQLASDQLAMTQAENNLILTKLSLSNLLLLSPDEAEVFEISAPTSTATDDLQTPPSVNNLFATAAANLPELRAADLRVRSNEVGIAVAKGGRSPQLFLRGSIGSGYSGNNQIGVGDPTVEFIPIGIVENSLESVLTPRESYEDFQPKDFQDQLNDNFNQSLSLSLNIPIFNGLSTTSNISRAKIDHNIAMLEKERERNQLQQDVQQAHADAVAAERSFEAANLALDAMSQNFTNAEKRFEQDMINTVDFNDAKSRLAVARTQAIRAKYEYIFRLTIIDFYMGKPINLQ